MQLIRASTKAVKNSLISKRFQNNTAKCPKVDQAHDYKAPPQPGSMGTDKAIRDIFKLKPKIEDLSRRSTAPPARDVQTSANKQKFYSGILSRIVPVRHQTTYGDSSNKVDFISQNREISVILEINNIRFGWLAKIKTPCKRIYLFKYKNA